MSICLHGASHFSANVLKCSIFAKFSIRKRLDFLNILNWLTFSFISETLLYSLLQIDNSFFNSVVDFLNIESAPLLTKLHLDGKIEAELSTVSWLKRRTSKQFCPASKLAEVFPTVESSRRLLVLLFAENRHANAKKLCVLW